MPHIISNDAIDDYFAKLNPIASKISQDINDTKLSYEYIWNALTVCEQIDIINETLMKPEISLKYFDSFSSSSSSSSILSLTNAEHKEKLKNLIKMKRKNIYNYDGKNLSTFSNQKTGMKIVHDDTIGIFRDEHSIPFSYKTRSQLNFHIFEDILKNNTEGATISEIPQNDTDDDDATTADGTGTQSAVEKFQKLNKEIKDTQKLDDNDDADGGDVDDDLKNFDEKNSNQNVASAGTQTPIGNDFNETEKYKDEATTSKTANRFLSKFIGKNNHLIFNAGPTLLSRANNDISFEGLNLMRNPSTYAVPFDDDDPEEDKTVCEDSKLLLDNDELRKGFDFLNNW